MANAIVGNKTIGGSTMGSWTQGLSAYDLACRYQGFNGTLFDYLESLKAISPVFSEPVIDGETGNITFTMTDKDGSHEIVLHDGHKVLLRNNDDNVLEWCYDVEGSEWQPLADLTNIMKSIYNEAHPAIIYVNELPNPTEAIAGVEYRVLQNGGEEP